MWSSVVNGQRLTFRLVGINNQNFIMADEQTGTWWQQVTGEALLGLLRGARLEMVPFDEVSLEIWGAENPGTWVLLPDAEYAEQYAEDDWEEEIAELPVPIGSDDGPLERRALVVGVTIGNRAKAYPVETLRQQSPISDQLGDTPLLLMIAPDGNSIRGFDRRVDGVALDLYAKPEAEGLVLVDTQTGSEWGFDGRAITGPHAGRELARVPAIKDFWFDWQEHNPYAALYLGGTLPSGASAAPESSGLIDEADESDDRE